MKAKSKIIRKDSVKQKPKARKEDKEEKSQEKEQDDEVGHEEIQEENEEGTKLDEDFGFDEGIASQRKAPVLESETGEKLEGMLKGVWSREKEEEKKEEIKYGFEKPKYSFLDEKEEAMEELRHVVLKEMPSLIERTHEARDFNNRGMRDSMLEHNEVEEYSVRYVPEHKEDVLRESDEIKGRKVDIKKYRNDR